MQPRIRSDVAKAVRDTAGIEAAMRKAVAKALDDRRRLGLPIVVQENGTIRTITYPK